MNRLSRLLIVSASLLVVAGHAAEAGNKRVTALFFEGCEKTCEGFKKGMADSNFPADVTIVDLKQDKVKTAEAVAEIQASKPDLVVVYGTTATMAALGTLEHAGEPQFIRDVPVVFTAVADPVGSKIVASLEKPGRANVTGTYNRVPEKLNIQAIRRLDPRFANLGMLFNANEANSVNKVKELTALGAKENFAVAAIELKSDGKKPPEVEEIARGLQALKDQGVRWVYVGSSSFLNANGKLFTETATRLGLAVVSPYPALVTGEQALMSIAAPREEVGALAAGQALKILRDGANPGDLPIEVAQHFVYTTNLNVAKALGITIPNAPEGKEIMTQDFFLSAQ